MASYFDEHNCEPLGDGEQPDHALHLARLLITTGFAADEEFQSMFDSKPPPASKEVVKNLPTLQVTEQQAAAEKKCPICLAEYDGGEGVKQLPCKHDFHPRCILPWLGQVNSCPVCRHELPTDDPMYESIREHKARQKQRDFEIESLHGSMYG